MSPMQPNISTAGEDVDLVRTVEELKRELTEAHRREEATAEILSAIRSSSTNIQRVFDTLAERAATLCEAEDANIFRRDGEQLLYVAHHGPIPFGPLNETHVPLVRGTVIGRSVLEARTIQVTDLQCESEDYPEGSVMARRYGYRAVLIVPLLNEGVAIGSINLRRTTAQPFTDAQVKLLQTFADQAVIAIENTRLFEAEQARTRELTERTQ